MFFWLQPAWRNSNVAKHFKIMIHAHWHWLICNFVCHVICLSGVISHPRDSWRWNIWKSTAIGFLWSHGETAVLVVSCKAVGFLSVACWCTWWNNRGPKHRLPSTLQTDGKSRDTKKGTKKQPNCRTRGVQELGVSQLKCISGGEKH